MATNATTLSTRGAASRRALIVALAFGAIAAVLVFAFLSRSNGGSVPTTPVLVAASDIPLGAEISDKNVTLRSIPSSAQHPLAFTSKTKATAIGQVALEPLTAGQQILSSQISQNRAQIGLTALIPEGQRAVSIAVTEVSAGGGFIKPGDKVDIIGTFPVDASTPAGDVVLGKNGRVVSVTLLQDVTVLAIGQAAITPSQVQPTGKVNPAGSAPTADQVAARSVTLALTPDQTQKVLAAQASGTLSLAIRSLNDKAPVNLQPQDNSLTRLPAPPNP